MSAENGNLLCNASVRLLRAVDDARVMRVFPDGPKLRYRAGQYGSLGLSAERDPSRLVKRAYSLSDSIIDRATGALVDPAETPYYEFYVNLVPDAPSEIERLSPKLFSLRDGDRIFCGTKIVGHYTLENVPPRRNILFLATTTGESPHNSMIGELLRENRPVRIANLVVGDARWRSQYAVEHALLAQRHPRYRRIAVTCGAYRELEDAATSMLQSADLAHERLGFALDPESCHVFLCGDPAMIGAPKKQGAWQYEYPDSGLMRIFGKFGFSLSTRFRNGSIAYESYW